MSSPQLSQIIITLRNQIIDHVEGITEEVKYGGVVFNRDKQLLVGLFLRKQFITIEFSFGNELQDVSNLLEGAGKQRRNLKLRDIDDIETKQVQYYLHQALLQKQ
ncbi:DUF1801 domain-containing protein [uncultured Vibrio sp.]|uniref:DUF1801 domain-containing protein n=1 Tax=uncultured Vibrio sp. TaxID=114054 RepID=UPI0026051FCE|nr:DUF1801 domain-containing protein [uncultured Vibrio sp.]